ncbi:hypothetical protein KY285_010541 [Solanum tuberosum]|nr:hypothetical protein KY285_010541 [Solanum tuberosum]
MRGQIFQTNGKSKHDAIFHIDHDFYCRWLAVGGCCPVADVAIRRGSLVELVVVGAAPFAGRFASRRWHCSVELLAFAGSSLQEKNSEGKGQGRERGEERKARRHSLLAGEEERRMKGRGGGALERGEEENE